MLRVGVGMGSYLRVFMISVMKQLLRVSITLLVQALQQITEWDMHFHQIVQKV